MTEERIACASLRLSPRKSWSQPHARAIRVPRVVDGAFDMAPRLPYPRRRRTRLGRQLYRWHRQLTHLLGIRRREHGAWGVPFSSDGNLYRTDRYRAFLGRAPRLRQLATPLRKPEASQR